MLCACCRSLLPRGHQPSFGRRMDVYISVRPSKIWYIRRRPLDTPIGRPTDVHLQPIQRRHVCKFISWTISSFIYFEVLCTKNFKYFSLSLKMRLLKRYQRMPGEAGKRTNPIFNSFLIWTNQFPVSFTAFLEKMPELRMFFTDSYGFTDVGWRYGLMCSSTMSG